MLTPQSPNLAAVKIAVRHLDGKARGIGSSEDGDDPPTLPPGDGAGSDGAGSDPSQRNSVSTRQPRRQQQRQSNSIDVAVHSRNRNSSLPSRRKNQTQNEEVSLCHSSRRRSCNDDAEESQPSPKKQKTKDEPNEAEQNSMESPSSEEDDAISTTPVVHWKEESNNYNNEMKRLFLLHLKKHEEDISCFGHSEEEDQRVLANEYREMFEHFKEILRENYELWESLHKNYESRHQDTSGDDNDNVESNRDEAVDDAVLLHDDEEGMEVDEEESAPSKHTMVADDGAMSPSKHTKVADDDSFSLASNNEDSLPAAAALPKDNPAQCLDDPSATDDLTSPAPPLSHSSSATPTKVTPLPEDEAATGKSQGEVVEFNSCLHLDDGVEDDPAVAHKDDLNEDATDNSAIPPTESKNSCGDRDLGVFEGIVAPFDNSEHYHLVEKLIQPRLQRLSEISKNNHIHGLLDAVGSDGLFQQGSLTPTFAKVIDSISPNLLLMLDNDFHCEKITAKMMSKLKKTKGFDPETQVGGYIRAFLVSLGELRNISPQKKKMYPKAWAVIEKQLKHHRDEPDDKVISVPYVGETSGQTITKRMHQENDPEIRDGAITNWEYGQILDREPLWAQVSLSQHGNKVLSWGLESCVAVLMEASSNVAIGSRSNIRMLAGEGYGLNAVNCGQPYFLFGKHGTFVRKYLMQMRWTLDGVSLMSDNCVDPLVKSYLTENAESILEQTGLAKLDDVQATHMLSMWGANGKKAVVENMQAQMGPGTTYDEAEKKLGRNAKKAAVEKLQKEMGPGTTYDEADKQYGKNGKKKAVQNKQKEMGPGTTYDEAKRQLAIEAGNANARKLDKKYNRRQEDKKILQCYKCWKLRGVEVTKELPLHDTETHSSGPLVGFPRVNRINGYACCMHCNPSGKQKGKKKSHAHKLWVEPHRITEVTNCCSVRTCTNGRLKNCRGTLYDKCRNHHGEENGWKY